MNLYNFIKNNLRLRILRDLNTKIKEEAVIEASKIKVFKKMVEREIVDNTTFNCPEDGEYIDILMKTREKLEEKVLNIIPKNVIIVSSEHSLKFNNIYPFCQIRLKYKVLQTEEEARDLLASELRDKKLKEKDYENNYLNYCSIVSKQGKNDKTEITFSYVDSENKKHEKTFSAKLSNEGLSDFDLAQEMIKNFPEIKEI